MTKRQNDEALHVLQIVSHVGLISIIHNAMIYIFNQLVQLRKDATLSTYGLVVSQI